MPLQIGSLTLPSKIIQSPLAACSDLPFRLIGREKGLGMCYLEMVSAQSLTRENAKTRRMLNTTPEDKPLGAQLLGCDPKMMADAAQILVELGFDLIDMNLGCPVKKVVGNGEGSALLKNPAQAEKVFRAVRDALPSRIPVTMKTRKGFQDPSGVEAVELAKRAEAAGLAAVTIHGRTQAQGYSGKSDWEAIGRVKAAVKIPVIGNGDVLTAADAKRLFEVSGCDGIMIGRGGLGNPWIYKNLDRGIEGNAEAYVPTVAERKETLLKHFALERKLLGDRQAALNMRRITVWYSQGLPHNKIMRVGVCTTMDCELIVKLISDFFDQLPADAPPPSVPILLAE